MPLTQNPPEPDGPELLQRRTLNIEQLTPFAENLPRCRAECRDGTQCMFSARYLQNDVPICGSHLGRPSVIFVRERRRVSR